MVSLRRARFSMGTRKVRARFGICIGDSALVVDTWERSAISHTRRLMSRRQKWQRRLQAAAPALLADSSDSSDSSSSGGRPDSSGSSSDSD